MLDSGNFSDVPSAEGDVKTRALLEGMSRMGYAAANLGERELRGGYDEFQRRSAGAKVPFLSANLVRQGDGTPVFPGHLVLDAVSPDGKVHRKVGVIGVLRYNPEFARPGPQGSTLTIAVPEQRVRAELAALRAQQVDVVVLLAAMHKDDATRVAAQVPGIDFVLGCYGGVTTETEERAGDAVLMYAGYEGQQIAELRVFLDAARHVSRVTTRLHRLSATYQVDQAMLDFVNSVPRTTPPTTEGAGEAAEPAAAPAGPYAGLGSCRGCHAAAFEQWSGTAHAHALGTLDKQNKAASHECLVCHTTGFALAGGFTDLQATPELAQVGCETCHGPGRAHTADPSRPYGKVNIGSCTVCHDRQRSPGFDYYSALPKVSHRERPQR
ncbi:MAG TPA: multiheme c-type cytochrome [Candidatus Polarisedimenticolaceae bacterium]|nr:multiheme c-type cytochrome [Candidatus Polarisedimenticolaceae bacterium]